MNPITNAIANAAVEEAKNQLANQASNATNTLSVLNGMPWPASLVLVLISLYAAWQALKVVRWLFKMIAIVGLGALLLFLGIKMIGG